MSARKAASLVPYVLIIVAFLADRLSKWWAAAYLAEHGSTTINAVLTLRETYNKGIAFGMFQGIGPLVGWLTVGVMVGMLIYLSRIPPSMWLLRAGIALIIGGGFGNQLDRITAGHVLDFIQTPLRSGIFNVADIMINLGLVLAVWGGFFQDRSTLEDIAQDEVA